ncbi:MarR family winged helix-turn-helix transcriptional regulator [Vibrio sp. SS-MA-C1-2]|uniref:MarR family winged helix-turn-helix transcriptional regulator n=1 Tax=Vibrio sp. SS-MA-C1-2 TaxID=2908646 RepID=UPI001F4413B7|nr:MarR family winged helix-turn-helix transcriptional regulator [Vibrio sp. SS-MA-C1-2]UJF18382.1 MarR family winged helix-turn-helix transcriptional regulator [Vibrio sp. SS-MA-C1-2]
MPKSRTLESLFQLSHSLKRAIHDHVESLGLAITPMHVRVLKVINHLPNCTAIDISHRLNRDKGQVTRLLNTLIEQDLISKQPNPNDKRSQCLIIEQQGKQILEKIKNLDQTVLKQTTTDISEQELEVFIRTLNKMNDNLSSK